MRMLRQISLNGPWRYEPRARVVLKPGGVLEEHVDDLPPAGEMILPVNWELGGLENFHGRVRFERGFDFDGLQEGEHSVWLVFKGVDYFAKVWLNDHLVGEHTGYFQPFSFDVTEVIRTGENKLVVDVTCPLEEPGTVWPHRKWLIKGVISHWDCRPGSWDLETGQDKNSGGIWNDVYLETRPVAYLGHVRVTTRLVPRDVPEGLSIGVELDPDVPQQAMVLVDTEVFGPAGEYILTVALGDEPPVTQPIALSQPGERHTVVVQVPSPRLWWTWDLGEPHLELCTIRLEQAGSPLFEKQVEVGLREIAFDPERGEWFLNGQRFFVRGTNVVPTLWLGEYDAPMIERDIALLRGAHINGVRVCVHVNRDEFYTACDRAGIIVWQDFALQWAYAETQQFVQEAVRQIKDMVRLLVNHPCIALWCCQNESSFHNKYILDPVLAEAVAAEDPSRPIHPTSEFSEHTYGGWYYGHYRDYSSLPATPVLTEFGAQALPDLEDVRAMVGETWPPDWDVLGYHDFQYDQTFHVAGIPLGDSWEQFVANSQAYQSRLLKFAIERYRQAKYKALGGMFQFMFMDCWPAITWSVLSYERTPKPGYWVLQQCYQPVLIGLNMERETIITGIDRGAHPRPFVVAPWVVNDRHSPITGCTYVVHLNGPGGQFEFVSDQPFDVPADGVLGNAPHLTLDLPLDLASGDYTLALTLRREDEVLSHNTYNLRIEHIP